MTNGRVEFAIAIAVCLGSLAIVNRAAPSTKDPGRFPPTVPCRTWLDLSPVARLELMAGLIEFGKTEGVTIRLPPAYYVRELDSLVEGYLDRGDLGGLCSPLGIVFHTIAAMEGDWGNGEPQLDHAKKWMGEWFETFRKLYPEKYQRLLDGRTPRE